MKPRIGMLVGIPGCGKSTWAARWFDVIISSDSIREQIADGVYDQSKNAEVFEIYHDRIDALLGHSYAHPVIADATHLSAESRAEISRIAEGRGAEVHVFVFTNLAQAVARNAERVTNRVPDDAMISMLAKYERTCVELPQEHYASITYISEVS